MDATLPLPSRIRQARYQKGVSQYNLAHSIGVHERTLVAWEAGEQAPSAANWEKLRVALKPMLDDESDHEQDLLVNATLESLMQEIDRRGFVVTVTPRAR